MENGVDKFFFAIALIVMTTVALIATYHAGKGAGLSTCAAPPTITKGE